MLGKQLKTLREVKGKSQLEVCSALNIEQSTLANYENDKRIPKLEILIKLAEYYNVSTDYLLGLTDERRPSTDLEWRYPPVQNRLGTILSRYREKNNLSNKDFAIQLDISEELEFDLESGKHSPSMSLIQKIAKVTKYDVDYITGARSETSIPNGKIDFNGILFDSFTLESDVHFKTRFEELCLKNGVTSERAETFLGLSRQDFTDIRYNRMPTLSELLKISYAFNVSVDYLIGRTDSLFISLTDDERKLLNNYRQLGEHYRNKVNTETSEQLLQQERDAYMRLSVAADTSLKKTGTDSGK